MQNQNRRAKCPWFKFYPTDFLGDKAVAVMSVEEVGAYCLLMFYAWQDDPRGSLADEDATLMRLARMSPEQWAASREAVLAPFVRLESLPGRILQPRMADEAVAAETRRQSLSDAGKRGAQKRWHGEANGEANGQAMAYQKPEATDQKPKTDTSKWIPNARDNSPKGMPNPSAGELYMHNPEIHDAWSVIPTNRRTGLGRFRVMWIEHVTRPGIDPSTVKAALDAYYSSDQGKGEFARGPARLIADLIWEESPEAWADIKADSKASDALDKMLAEEEA